MLDTRAHLRTGAVVGLLLGTERLLRLAFLADMALVASFLEHRLGPLAAVGAIGPYPGIDVVGVDQIVEHLAVVHVRRSDFERADALVLGIDVDVVLLAEVALGILLREARLNVLLLALGLAPILGYLSVLDATVLLAAVALDRSRNLPRCSAPADRAQGWGVVRDASTYGRVSTESALGNKFVTITV